VNLAVLLENADAEDDARSGEWSRGCAVAPEVAGSHLGVHFAVYITSTHTRSLGSHFSFSQAGRSDALGDDRLHVKA
jgi:hypothetical protein